MAAKAKAPYEKGRKGDGKMQPMTLYGPIMEGVDTRKLLDFLLKYKDKHPEEILECDVGSSLYVFGGFPKLLENAREKCDIYLDYDTVWIKGNTQTDIATIDGTFVPDVDGTNVFDLSYTEIESVKQASSFVDFARKYFPGFEKSRRIDRGGFLSGSEKQGELWENIF